MILENLRQRNRVCKRMNLRPSILLMINARANISYVPFYDPCLVFIEFEIVVVFNQGDVRIDNPDNSKAGSWR